MVEDVLVKVRDCAVDVLQVEPGRVTKETRFREDLGVTSLSLVEFVMALEEVFGIRVSEDDMSRVETVADACELVIRPA